MTGTASGVVCADGVHATVDLPERASFSMLDGFDTCPARWVADRVHGGMLRPWDARILGRIVHGALERTIGSDGRVPADWVDACRTAIDRDPGLLEDATGDPGEWARRAGEKLRGFHPDLSFRPVAVEQEAVGTVWGVPFHGFVDYRDETGMVLDWKTGRVPDPSYGDRHGDQLRVYALMLRAMGVHVSWAGDVYVEHGHGVVRVADLSDGAVERTGRRLAGAWRRLGTSVERGVFPYRPGGLCGWCPLALKCPVACLPTVKARQAAASQWARDDPRMPLDDVMSGRVACGFMPVAVEGDASSHAGDNDGKETVMNVGNGRPYEPTVTDDGDVNLNGYAMSGLVELRALADRLAGGDPVEGGRVYGLLVDAVTACARRAWPTVVPRWDGKDRRILCMIMDMGVARDVRRVMGRILDECDSDGLVTVDERIRMARNRTWLIVSDVKGTILGRCGKDDDEVE